MNPLGYLETARKLTDAILDLVPATVAHQMLDDAAVRRANAIADIAEAAKFSKFGDDEP